MKRGVWMVCLVGLGMVSCASERMKVVANDDYGVPAPSGHGRLTYYIGDGIVQWDEAAPYTRNLHREIARQLELRGYRPDANDPDVLVFCSVFSQNLAIPDLHRINRQNPGEGPRFERQTRYLHDGALLIQFLDTREQQVYWVGHANGLKKRPLTERSLPVAARTVLDQYRQLADGFLARSH